MAKKLSKTQQEVVDLMRDGWEFGVSLTFDGGCWLQKGGCGRGGETKRVSSNTLVSMRNSGLIVCSSSKFPLAIYKLAEPQDGK